jgi:CheY-like chemotaxis protein
MPTGVEAEFFIPERHLAGPEHRAGEDRQIQPPAVGSSSGSIMETRPLQGLSVLLLEDNLIVALEAEDLLRTLGASSIATASSIGAAAEICETTSIGFAVLDVNLGFENSLSFAARLRSANTPFVFASGYSEQEVPGESRVSELTVSKPYNLESLRGAIALTLSRSL